MFRYICKMFNCFQKKKTNEREEIILTLPEEPAEKICLEKQEQDMIIGTETFQEKPEEQCDHDICQEKPEKSAIEISQEKPTNDEEEEETTSIPNSVPFVEEKPEEQYDNDICQEQPEKSAIEISQEEPTNDDEEEETTSIPNSVPFVEEQPEMSISEKIQENPSENMEERNNIENVMPFIEEEPEEESKLKSFSLPKEQSMESSQHACQPEVHIKHAFGELFPDPTDCFDLGKVIGTGGFGVVHKAWDVTSMKKVAIKVIQELTEEENILSELYVQRSVSCHRSFPDYYGAYYERSEDSLWIAMEFLSGGSVADLIETKNYSLGEHWIAYICKEVLLGLTYLQEMNVIHHDLKGLNIMLTSSAQVKIIDFGLATVGSKSNSTAGTINWMAPEVFACIEDNTAQYDFKADVWSLGITAIEMAEGCAPYMELSDTEIYTKIMHDPSPGLTWEEWSVIFNSFVDHCLCKDPSRRPSAEQLLSHPFITYNSYHMDDVKNRIAQHIQKGAKN